MVNQPEFLAIIAKYGVYSVFFHRKRPPLTSHAPKRGRQAKRAEAEGTAIVVPLRQKGAVVCEFLAGDLREFFQ